MFTSKYVKNLFFQKKSYLLCWQNVPVKPVWQTHDEPNALFSHFPRPLHGAILDVINAFDDVVPLIGICGVQSVNERKRRRTVKKNWNDHQKQIKY